MFQDFQFLSDDLKLRIMSMLDDDALWNLSRTNQYLRQLIQEFMRNYEQYLSNRFPVFFLKYHFCALIRKLQEFIESTIKIPPARNFRHLTNDEHLENLHWLNQILTSQIAYLQSLPDQLQQPLHDNELEIIAQNVTEDYKTLVDLEKGWHRRCCRNNDVTSSNFECQLLSLLSIFLCGSVATIVVAILSLSDSKAGLGKSILLPLLMTFFILTVLLLIICLIPARNYLRTRTIRRRQELRRRELATITGSDVPTTTMADSATREKIYDIYTELMHDHAQDATYTNPSIASVVSIMQSLQNHLAYLLNRMQFDPAYYSNDMIKKVLTLYDRIFRIMASQLENLRNRPHEAWT